MKKQLTLNQRAVIAALKYNHPSDVIVATIKELANQPNALVKSHNKGNHVIELKNGLKIIIQSCDYHITTTIQVNDTCTPESHTTWRTAVDYQEVIKKLGPRFSEKLKHVLLTAIPFYWYGNN